MQSLLKLVVSLFLVFTLVFTGMTKPATALTVASPMNVSQSHVFLASSNTQIAAPANFDWKGIVINFVVSYALEQIFKTFETAWEHKVNASEFGSDLWYGADLPVRLPLLNNETHPGSEYPQILF